MPNFSGTLNRNLIQNAIFNMITSQMVFADNIGGVNDSLVSKARVDGSMYGDQKLYYSTDCLKSRDWLNDQEAGNLLALNRPKAPEVQSIVMNVFRIIELTTDQYLTKQAFQAETAFSDYTSVMMNWMNETKRIYESCLYNCYIGCNKGAAAGSSQTIDITTAVGSTTGEEAARLEGQAIAQGLADILGDLTDLSRGHNDYGFLRSYAKENIVVVWNRKWANKVTKMDLPTIFHDQGLVDKLEQEVLPPRFFGNIVTSAGTVTSASGERSLIETDYTVSSVVTHVFPGEKLPVGATYLANTTYTEDADIICKILVKLPVIMSGFAVGTSFFNPKSLTQNNYLIFAHNTLEYFKNYPFIEVKKI